MGEYDPTEVIFSDDRFMGKEAGSLVYTNVNSCEAGVCVGGRHVVIVCSPAASAKKPKNNINVVIIIFVFL